jgi:hypothetical protein
MLGAAGGLFSISVFLLVARVDAYYSYLSWLEETSYTNYDRGVEDLWWIPVSFWHVLLSVVASFMAHRYLATRQKSPFLLWQTVGFIALLGWGLSFAITVGLNCLMRGEMNSLERAMSFVGFGDLAKYISVVLVSNVFFGSAMLASSRQYLGEDAFLVQTEQIEEVSVIENIASCHKNPHIFCP